MYGVYTENGETTSLIRVEDTPQDALKFLGKYALFRAFGDVPLETLRVMCNSLAAAHDTVNVSKVFTVNGLVYYIERIAEETLEGF